MTAALALEPMSLIIPIQFDISDQYSDGTFRVIHPSFPNRCCQAVEDIDHPVRDGYTAKSLTRSLIDSLRSLAGRGNSGAPTLQKWIERAVGGAHPDVAAACVSRWSALVREGAVEIVERGGEMDCVRFCRPR